MFYPDADDNWYIPQSYVLYIYAACLTSQLLEFAWLSAWWQWYSCFTRNIFLQNYCIIPHLRNLFVSKEEPKATLIPRCAKSHPLMHCTMRLTSPQKWTSLSFGKTSNKYRFIAERVKCVWHYFFVLHLHICVFAIGRLCDPRYEFMVLGFGNQTIRFDTKPSLGFVFLKVFFFRSTHHAVTFTLTYNSGLLLRTTCTVRYNGVCCCTHKKKHDAATAKWRWILYLLFLFATKTLCEVKMKRKTIYSKVNMQNELYCVKCLKGIRNVRIWTVQIFRATFFYLCWTGWFKSQREETIGIEHCGK